MKIIDFCENKDFNAKTAEIWRSKTIIELMKVLKRTQNRELVTNALLLILSFFEQLPIDLYNEKGIRADCLGDDEKSLLLSELRLEFGNELPN